MLTVPQVGYRDYSANLYCDRLKVFPNISIFAKYSLYRWALTIEHQLSSNPYCINVGNFKEKETQKSKNQKLAAYANYLI